jgi:hypothetical protein
MLTLFQLYHHSQSSSSPSSSSKFVIPRLILILACRAEDTRRQVLVLNGLASGAATPHFHTRESDNMQCPGLVQRDVIGLVAFDLILRVLFARMMSVAFVVHVARMYLHDVAADPARFRIPGNVIANFEFLVHY